MEIGEILLSQKVINENVLRGIEINSQRSGSLINRHMPAVLSRVGREFLGQQGSQVNRYLRSGDISYRMYSFTKD